MTSVAKYIVGKSLATKAAIEKQGLAVVCFSFGSEMFEPEWSFVRVSTFS